MNHSNKSSNLELETTEELLARLRNSSLPRVHLEVTAILKNREIMFYTPFIVDIMLNNYSLPLYDLLLYKSKEMKFRISLFFYLKSILSDLQMPSAAMCYYLCGDIIDLEMKNTQNYRRGFLGFLRARDGRTSAIHQKICPISKLSRNTKKQEDGKISYEAPLAKRRAYFTKNRFIVKPQAFSLQGIFLFFLKTVFTSVCRDLDAEKCLKQLIKPFRIIRNIRGIVFRSNCRHLIYPRHVFRHSLNIYQELIKISENLQELPKWLKNRFLTVRLELLNMEINRNVCIDLCTGKRILAVHSSSSQSMLSKDNSPYLVNFIVENNSYNGMSGKIFKQDKVTEVHRDYQRVSSLMKQFIMVRDLEDIGDLDGVRSSILDAMERILAHRIIGTFEPTGDSKLSALSEYQLSMESHVKTQCENTVKSEETEECKSSDEMIQETLVDENYYEDRIRWHKSNYKSFSETKNNKSELYYDKIASVIRKSQMYKEYSLPSDFELISYIVKNNSNMKEEYTAFRIITQVLQIFEAHNLPIYLRNYQIFIISKTSGLVETVKNTKSIHKIKQQFGSLRSYFEKTYNNVSVAKNNFLYSLVGYSIIQYLLQLKDRHNDNILLDEKGHIVHVDFGFILGKHPGIYGVEVAPFKFSDDYLELINLIEFRVLFIEGFECLVNCRDLIPEVRERLEIENIASRDYAEQLISKSVGNMLTVFYDQIQYFQNGYFH